MQEKKTEQIEYKPMSKKQLCAYFDNISMKTLNTWIKPFKNKIGEYRGRVYTPGQIKKIIELLS